MTEKSMRVRDVLLQHACRDLEITRYAYVDTARVRAWFDRIPSSALLPFSYRTIDGTVRVPIPQRMLAPVVLDHDPEEEHDGYHACVVCTNRITRSSRVVGCSNEHSMHIDCYAISMVLLPTKNRWCIGSAFSSCPQFPTTIDPPVSDDDYRLHTITMTYMKQRATSAEMRTLIERYMKRRRRMYCVSPRADMSPTNVSEDDVCIACGNNIGKDRGVLRACSKHVVHQMCHALWINMCDDLTTPPEFECPAPYFSENDACEGTRYRMPKRPQHVTYY